MTTDVAADLDRYVQAVLGKQAMDLTVLDVSALTSVADVFMICSGRSNRQVSAIADHIQTALKEQGIRPLSIEGKTEGHWVLMDYAHVVIHIFLDDVRRFYDLEGLWADAPRVMTPALKRHINSPQQTETMTHGTQTDDIDDS
ncbi:MAG: ribosome silencing factor [Pseudomonadota bacterium]